MTHRTEVLIRSMSRRVKVAHLLIAKVKKRIWPVKRPLATAVKGENLQNEMLPRLQRPRGLERKAKLAIFSLFAAFPPTSPGVKCPNARLWQAAFFWWKRAGISKLGPRRNFNVTWSVSSPSLRFISDLRKDVCLFYLL